MAAIKGWVYLIFGAVMIVSSQLVKYDDGTKPLRVFLYVGIVFVIIGIAKYVHKRKPEEEQNQNAANQTITQEQVHQQRRVHHSTRSNQSFNQQTSPLFQQPPSNFSRGQHHLKQVREQPMQHASIIACPMCGTRHYDYAHYCMRCGTRIKDIRER